MRYLRVVRMKKSGLNIRQKKKTIMLPTLLFTIIVATLLTGYAFAEIKEMGKFLPNKENLPSYWKIGPLNTIDKLEIESSNENPDGVLKQFALENQTGESAILVTLSIYEFSDDSVSEKVHRNYTTNLMEDYESLKIKDFTNSDCFGVIKDKNKITEASSVTCSKDKFLIISTAQQKEGKVYEKGIKLQTSQVSAGFAEFVIDQIDEKYSDFPSWIRQNVIWFLEGSIDESTFLHSIQYMISKGYLAISDNHIDITQTSVSKDDKEQLNEWASRNSDDSKFVEIIKNISRNQNYP